MYIPKDTWFALHTKRLWVGLLQSSEKDECLNSEMIFNIYSHYQIELKHVVFTFRHNKIDIFTGCFQRFVIQNSAISQEIVPCHKYQESRIDHTGQSGWTESKRVAKWVVSFRSLRKRDTPYCIHSLIETFHFRLRPKFASYCFFPRKVRVNQNGSL